MIPVTLDQLFLSNLGFVLLLKSSEDERTLPIFIGAAEAQSIAIHLNGVNVPRPLTHDLLKNLLDFLECRLQRVEIVRIEEGTFYAELVMERYGEILRIDARPSDAIAVALRVGAPLFVAEPVMAEAGRTQVVDEDADGGETVKDPKGRRRLTPRELLDRQLKKAIKDERYEDAARLRDQIKHLDDTHGSN
jgi:bifunctional DNase/RNase